MGMAISKFAAKEIVDLFCGETSLSISFGLLEV